MRSRDGNYSITRAICSIILINSIVYPPFLMADTKEFLISYRYVVKDATLYNEALQISNSMKKCNGELGEAIILPTFGDEDLELTISKNSEEFIEYIHKLGLHIQHKEITINSQNKSSTIMTLKTRCFKVDFNDNFARIAPLK